MRVCIKKIKLFIYSRTKTLYRILGMSLAYVPTIFSVIVLLLILGTNLAHRAPILDYFIEELKLPLVFSLTGRIIDLTRDSTIGGIRAKVNIGGYQSETDIDGFFRIKFSSPTKIDIPVVITFINADVRKTVIRYISFSEKSYIEQREFFINDHYCASYHKFRRK